jgi:hypothetical protein
MAKTDGRTKREREQRDNPLARARIDHPFEHTVTVKTYQTVAPVPGAVVAKLAVANLAADDDALRFMSTFSLHDRAIAPPTLEQLRLAQTVMRALEVAVMTGNNVQNWELVKRAATALCAKDDKRRAVAAILKDCLRSSRDATANGLEFHARVALAALEEIDVRFGSVDTASLVSLVRQINPRLGHLGIAAKLCLQSGALDAEQGTNETAVDASRRVRQSFEKSAAA